MFYERVPVPSGIPLFRLLEGYGLLAQSQAILRQPNNGHLGPVVPDRSFVQPTHIHLPIAVTLSVTRAVRVIDRNGLRPTRIPRGGGTPGRTICTHGIEIRVRRSPPACQNIRWVQTVSRREPHAPARAFVDGGGNGLPFYNTTTTRDPSQSPQEFDDVPCGLAAAGPGPSLVWSAVLSAVVWTGTRITLAASLRYGFAIHPDDRIQVEPPRPASAAEIQDQLRILRTGLSGIGTNSGLGLDYRAPPAPGSVNAY